MDSKEKERQDKPYKIKIPMTPAQALLRICRPHLPKTKYESIKDKQVNTKHKKDDVNITELDRLTKLLSVGLKTTSSSNLTARVLSTGRDILNYEKITKDLTKLKIKSSYFGCG